MTKEVIAEKKEKLAILTKTMDIPDFRRDKPSWLSRNMQIRNSEHPNFPEANILVKELMAMGVH